MTDKQAKPMRFLGRAQVAQRMGIKPGSLKEPRYQLPEPDALVGEYRGWLPETIDAYIATRPGRGNWGHK